MLIICPLSVWQPGWHCVHCLVHLHSRLEAKGSSIKINLLSLNALLDNPPYATSHWVVANWANYSNWAKSTNSFFTSFHILLTLLSLFIVTDWSRRMHSRKWKTKCQNKNMSGSLFFAPLIRNLYFCRKSVCFSVFAPPLEIDTFARPFPTVTTLKLGGDIYAVSGFAVNARYLKLPKEFV